MEMHMELYSTESAYRLATKIQEPETSGNSPSIGYYEVVLATALISLLWFLVDLARKLGLVDLFPSVKVASSSPKVRHLRQSSTGADNHHDNLMDVSTSSISVPWKMSIPKMPVLGNSTTMAQIKKWFPSAIVNQDLVLNIKDALEPYGYGETSLIATSLCSDEVNRPLERDLFGVYEHHFAMGGLSGVPFGGVTAFGAMAQHIPDGGSCLIVGRFPLDASSYCKICNHVLLTFPSLPYRSMVHTSVLTKKGNWAR